MSVETPPWLSYLLQASPKRYFYENLEKKVSFMPLENATVEMIDEKKHVFTVKDKFKSIMFKTTSREDMFGWYLIRYLGFWQ